MIKNRKAKIGNISKPAEPALPQVQLKTVPKNQCGRCGRYFNKVSAFDKHRTGNYEESIYDKNRNNVIGHTPSTRRCMTSEEMIAAGMDSELCMVKEYHDGKPVKTQQLVWFDAVGRERVKEHFKTYAETPPRPREGTCEDEDE